MSARFFHPRANLIARTLLALVPFCAALIGWGGWQVQQSSYLTAQDVVIDQPVPFSHQHHVGQLGLDCRVCHVSVETSAFAGIPPVKTCMSCHSQIWTNAAVLAPVRDAWRDNHPLAWNRVNALPQYVYFDHSAHVNKGVGCATCHGQVDQMPLMRQATPMTMSWCLDCHRHPEQFLRPREAVFDMSYTPPADQATLGHSLVSQYGVRSAQAMTDCVTCHR